MKKNNKGFTLVELLVVIAIIGILAVVAVPALFKNIEKGKVADLEADISAIKSAALSVYSDTSAYENGIIIGSGAKAEKTLEELEGLSNPFKALEYKLEGVTPSPLVLEITFQDSSKLSKNAFDKLQRDLGSDVVPFNKQGTPAQGVEGEEGYNPATDASYDPSQPIKINLINK